MNYKMIVLDLDDTLMQDDQTIGQRTKEALMQAQAAGIKVVLASGRPTFGMLPVAKELALSAYDSYILSYNGGKMHTSSEMKEVFALDLPATTVHEMYDLSKKFDVGIHTYTDSTIITEQANPYTDVESTITKMNVQVVPCFKSAITFDAPKILFVDAPEKLIEMEQAILASHGENYSIMRSKPFFLEVMPKGIDKGATLAKLAAKLDILPEEIIAFGDSYNDQSMLKFAGLGIAMGNSPDEIKAIANAVTDTNNEEGIANALEKYVFCTTK